MGRIARDDLETASGIDDYQHVIAFRNVLIHGYDVVAPDEVWRIAEESLPRLLEQVRALLSDTQSEA